MRNQRIHRVHRGTMMVKCAMCGYIGEIALYREWFKWGAKAPDLYLCDDCKYGDFNAFQKREV